MAGLISELGDANLFYRQGAQHGWDGHRRSKLVSVKKSGQGALAKARKKEYKIIEKAIPGVNPDRVAEARELLLQMRKIL